LDAQSHIRYQIHISSLNVNIKSSGEALALKGDSLDFYSEFGVVEEANSGFF